MKRYRFAIVIASLVVGCSYINGQGDAEKFVEQFKSAHMSAAKSVTHTCQTRDTDDNGYVSCTVTVDWGIANERPEIVPIECAVNKVGSGCNVEGCRPLSAFGMRRGPSGAN